MKKILTILLVFIPFIGFAQNLVNFKLDSDASFISPDEKDFIVVPFKGKNAHQIYKMLASNVGTVYKDPSKVMSGVDGASIKIRAFSRQLFTQKVLGISHAWEGYYQLEFRIKDGRVRVSAPIVEESIMAPTLEQNVFVAHKGWFPALVKKWFKNGAPKEKDLQKIEEVQTEMNGLINAILGLAGTTSTVGDDW